MPMDSWMATVVPRLVLATALVVWTLVCFSELRYPGPRAHRSNTTELFIFRGNFVDWEPLSVERVSSIADVNRAYLWTDFSRAILHHVPKTGGSSLQEDARRITDRKVDELEACAPKRYDAKELNLLMLREPRAHVQSQFMHVRFHNLKDAQTKKELGVLKYLKLVFPRAEELCTRRNCSEQLPPESLEANTRDIRTWLAYFEPGGQWQAAGSQLRWDSDDGRMVYNPYNMQTRALTCDRSTQFSLAFVDPEKDLELNLTAAKEMVLKMQWVGITSLYSVSLCVLGFQMTGILPDGCGCSTDHSINSSHITWSSPPHKLADVPSDVLATIDRFTAVDRELFAFAERTVRNRIAYVERVTRTKLICQ